MKSNLNFENIKIFYLLIIFFFSIFVNQYYGYIGILPIDSFLIFNSGYDLLNGYYPFKDYCTIKEPFIDLVQAIFFKLFGVSWFSYVLHASTFNCLITIFTFFFMKKFNLDNIIRITGDALLFDYEMINIALDEHIKKNYDVTFIKNLPFGTAKEMFTFETIESIVKNISYSKQ